MSAPTLGGGAPGSGGPRAMRPKKLECWGADKPFANMTENNLTAKSIAITVRLRQRYLKNPMLNNVLYSRLSQ